MQTFDVPFASAGDKAAIPVPAQGDGSVSYTTGFTLDYEAELGVDPNAKPVPRDQTNQVLYEITDSLGQTMKHGYMPWQAGAYTGGFPINARVYHNGRLWQSIVANNTVEPTAGNSASWADVSRVIVDASDTLKGVARFATLAEHRDGVALDLMTNPAGVLAAIRDALPKNLGVWSSSTPIDIAAQNSWVDLAVLPITVRAGYPVQLSAKVVGMNQDVSSGDNLWGVRLIIGGAVYDVTTRNVGGGQTESNTLSLGARASIAAGNHQVKLQVIKTFGAGLTINAEWHNKSNSYGTRSWLQVDEGAQ